MLRKIIYFHIFFFNLMIFFALTSNAVTNDLSSTKSPQMLMAFQQNVLKRRTRSVIFPKKAQLLLTPSFTKAITGGIPRGLFYSMEFDMYQQLPDTVDGWKPKILHTQIEREKTLNQIEVTSTTAVATTTSSNDTNMIMRGDYFDDSYMDGQRFYQFPFQYYYDDSCWDCGQSRIDINDSNREAEETPYHIHPLARNFHLRPFKVEDSQYSFYDDSIDDASIPSWYDNPNYRQRRELFDQLETAGKMFNINIKACIKRAMCEITTHLKPYGDSLMDDIIRIILTIPIPPEMQSHFNDDYSHRHYAAVNCVHRFATSCPYRVLHILTQKLRNKSS